MRRTVRTMAAIGILAIGCGLRLQAHESPVDQVSRTLTLWMENDRLRVRYEEQISERNALLELYAMDRNRDGIIQNDEEDAFLTGKAKRLAGQITLSESSGPAVKLIPAGPVVLRRGLRQVYEFAADVSGFGRGPHNLTLVVLGSRQRPGPFQATIGRPRDLPAGEGPREKVGALSGAASSAGSLRGAEDKVSVQLTL